MSDLLREVDDAVRADNMKRLWEEHKHALVTGVAALILGTAAMAFWNNWNSDRNQKHTGEIVLATQAKDPAAALTTVAKDQSGNAQVIAYLNAAALELKAGNKQKALDAYTSAQAAKSADSTLRDLATLQKTNLTLDLKPDAKTEDLIAELKPVAENKKSPWQGEALFMTAFLKGERSKDYAGAITDLKTLQARDDVTESIKQRAQALQSVYDLKLQETK